MIRKQQTLARVATLDGFGFWTGQDVRLEFHPAEENSGIRFLRTDLSGAEPIPALTDFRIDKPRQTSLLRGTAQVDMIEHVMAALRGAGIDNCEIRINGSEMPGFDGSAAPFYQVITAAGISVQSKAMPCRVITRPARYEFENGYIDVAPGDQENIRFGYQLSYDEDAHPIGNQHFETLLSPAMFEKEIMTARTFLLLREAEYLRANGLCKRVSPVDVLVFGKDGPVDNSLRFENECARHKVLDMIGDFALAPWLWIGSIKGCRTGHQQNAATVRKLMECTELLCE